MANKGINFYDYTTIEQSIANAPKTDPLARAAALWTGEIIVRGAAPVSVIGHITTSAPQVKHWHVHMIGVREDRVLGGFREFFDRVNEPGVNSPFLPALLVVADNMARSEAHWIGLEDRLRMGGRANYVRKAVRFLTEQNWRIASSRPL